MLLGRMAYRLSLLCLAPWITLPAFAAVATTNITPEVLNFVPTCAQNCFESFISANFDASICGNSPSLECLCRQQGSSGYTVGEGAVSCLAGESRFGACQGQDGITTAYNMCVGISKAEPMTHSTIVATLVVPSGTGPLLVPTAISTATSKPTVTTAPTPTPTVSLPTGNEPSSTLTTPSSVASPTSTATESPAAATGRPQLDSAQIAGITLGCVAVVVFGILLVFLARCVRRKRFGDLEAGFSKMRDSMSFGRKSRPSSAPGIQISSPIPKVQAKRNPTDPRWQPGVQQQGAGLAISSFAARGGVFARPSPAPTSAPVPPLPPIPAPTPSPAPAPAVAAQSVPRLVLSRPPAAQPPRAERSPPKPTLTLAIPKGPQQVVRVPASGRDSVVTEFAEDGEGELAPGTTIWRPPATDPLSATTIYFADKGGNWILRNASTRRPEMQTSKMVLAPTKRAMKEVPRARAEIELPSPDHKTKAERAKDAYGGFSPDAVVSPLRLPRRSGQARLGSPIAFKDQRREPQLSSPSLSERLSQTAETLGGESTQAANRPSNMFSSAVREARDLTGGRIKRRPSRRASRRVSQDSATSIESAAAGPFESENAAKDESQLDLSPVAESPHTPISPGKSPVTYPNIRKRNDIQQLPVSAKGPGLAGAPRYNVWHPPGYASPTGASVLPSIKTVKGGVPEMRSSERPRNAPGSRPAPSRNPGQTRGRAPGTGFGPVSPIEKQYWQRQRQVANPASYWNQPQNPPARARAARPPPPPPTPPYELPANEKNENSPRRPATQTPPQSQQQRRPTPTTRPTELPTPQATPGGGDTSSSQSQSQSQQHQSTLLAKRRGADKAAALTLAANNGNGKGSGDATARRAKKPGWTKEDPSSYGPVPITPGWVPELTPTRRGEDLYLNVR
ncbi:hypothetical protein C8A03DRAFT_12386 [Achaetomium macrosporum]|uniref:Extracellular membrane protein CFEM domain-containing protein n=1 Tax=Achaetomium macrosporum TaxID=79813 RepID=A0AAN7H9G4_9PEZI|nr:hypothetical protein C8A03DRAFT_12386 [Achaetomium macrosporum]